MAPLKYQNLSAYAYKYLVSLHHIQTLSPNTYKAYAIDLAQFLDIKQFRKFFYASNVKDQDGTDFDCQPEILEKKFLQSIQRAQERWADLAPATRNRKWACIKGFAGWLYENRFFQRELSLHIYLTKVPEKVPHFISVDEVFSLLNVLPVRKIDRVSKILFFILYGGGLRISEACHLKWSDLNWSQHSARVLGKGDKERLVTFPKFVFDALAIYHNIHRGPFIVGDELPLSQSKGYRLIQQLGTNAGLTKPLHPHALRHSFATHLLSSGADLRVLQELLGHASLKSTQRYTHLNLEDLAKTLETFHPLSINKK